MRLIWMFLLCAIPALLSAQTRDLTIYWVDVEGGAATLIVSPSGQSLLVDTGNPTPDDRDAKRIFSVAQQAGLKQIDNLVITHFHMDHVGGVAALSKLIPIERFYDHGDSIETRNPRDKQDWENYLAASKGKRTIVKPGDRIPLRGVPVEVLTADAKQIDKPLKGGGPNPLCSSAQDKPADHTENQRSVSLLVTYGKFKFLDMGDLTWDREMAIACPVNRIGAVTLFQTTHHGFFHDFSGAPALVWAIKPQTVVVNNGPRKGLQPSAWETISKIPDVEGIWQVHLSLASDKSHNTSEQMIANLEASAECKGNYLKASVARDGKYTITNSRNGYSKSYTAR
ncbi:MAG TPA: MBL fold metallo-hydrolase [Bryobacteraceae bacterium]|nr:MBL fold metallo-hydrolase [Bryobacteraceae bacterium]